MAEIIVGPEGTLNEDHMKGKRVLIMTAEESTLQVFVSREFIRRLHGPRDTEYIISNIRNTIRRIGAQEGKTL